MKVLLHLASVMVERRATVVEAVDFLLTAREMKACMLFFFAIPSLRTKLGDARTSMRLMFCDGKFE